MDMPVDESLMLFRTAKSIFKLQLLLVHIDDWRNERKGFKLKILNEMIRLELE